MRKNKIKKFLSFIGTATLVASPIIAMGGGLLNNNPIVKNSNKQTAPVKEAVVQTVSNTACFDTWITFKKSGTVPDYISSFVINDGSVNTTSSPKNSIKIPIVETDPNLGFTIGDLWEFNLDPEITDITIDLSKVKIKGMGMPSSPSDYGNLTNVKIILPESMASADRWSIGFPGANDDYPIKEIVYPENARCISGDIAMCCDLLERYNVPEGVNNLESGALSNGQQNKPLSILFNGNNKNIVLDRQDSRVARNIDFYFSSQELVDTYQGYINNNTNGWGQIVSEGVNYHLYSYSTQENFDLTSNANGRFINECYAIEKNNLTDFAGQSIKFGIDSPDTNFNNSFKWEFVTAQDDFAEVIGSNSSNMTLSTDGLLTFPSTITDTSSNNLKSVIFTLKATNIYDPNISKTFDVRLGTTDNPMPEWAHVAADFYIDNWTLDKTNINSGDDRVINRLFPASNNFPSGEKVIIPILYTDAERKNCILADTMNDAYGTDEFSVFSNRYSYAFSFENLPEGIQFSGLTNSSVSIVEESAECGCVVEIKMPDEITIDTNETSFAYSCSEFNYTVFNLSYLNIPKFKNKNGEEMVLNFTGQSTLATSFSRNNSFYDEDNTIFHQASRGITIEFNTDRVNNYVMKGATSTIFAPSNGCTNSFYVDLTLKFPTRPISTGYENLSKTESEDWNIALSDAVINNNRYGSGFKAVFDYKYNALDLGLTSSVTNPSLSLNKGYSETIFDSNPITYNYELTDKNKPVDPNIDLDTTVANSITATLLDENGTSPLDISQISIEKAASDKTYNIKVAPGLDVGDYKFRAKFDYNYGDTQATITSDVITLTISPAAAQSVQILDLDNTGSIINSTLTLTGTYGQPGQRRLQAKVLPEDANQSVNWSISGNSSGIDLDTQGNNATITWDGTLDWNNSPFSFQITATTTSSPQQNKTITVNLTIPQPSPESIVIKDNNESPIENLELNGKGGVEDQYDRLKATVSPSDAVQGVNWSISNWYDSGLEEKVSISNEGIIKWKNNIVANNQGYRFQVKATSSVLETVSKTIEVALKISQPDATGVEILDQNDSVINQTLDLTGEYGKNGTYTLGAKVLPDDAIQSVTWSIRNNDSGISFSYNGNNATISWNNSLNYGMYTFYINAATTTSPKQSKEITVNLTIPREQPQSIVINDNGGNPIEALELNGKGGVADKYESLKATVSPTDASQNVKWSISNWYDSGLEGKVSIDSQGTIKWGDNIVANNQGYRFQVKATSSVLETVSKTIEVTLKISQPDATGVEILDQNDSVINQTLDLTGEYGQSGTYTLSAKVLPNDAIQSVTWSIRNNNSGIILDSNGNRATLKWDGSLNFGTYTFYVSAVTTSSPQQSKEITVNLDIPRSNPTDIKIYVGDDCISSYNKSTKINEGGSEQFRAVVGPEGASQEVTWEITGLSAEDNGKISIDRTSGLLQWSDTLNLGNHSFKIKVNSNVVDLSEEINANISVSNTNPNNISIYDGGTEITSQTGLSLTGQEGKASSKKLTAKITPADAAQVVKWKIVSWSTGGNQASEIAIDANTGLITWSGNLKAGTYSFTIQAYADADNSVAKDFVTTLTVNPKPAKKVIYIDLIIGIICIIICLILLVSAILLAKKNKEDYHDWY